MAKVIFPNISIYFVSPGEGAVDAPLHINGKDVVPLSEKGREQAGAAARFMADRLEQQAQGNPDFGRIKVYYP